MSPAPGAAPHGGGARDEHGGPHVTTASRAARKDDGAAPARRARRRVRHRAPSSAARPAAVRRFDDVGEADLGSTDSEELSDADRRRDELSPLVRRRFASMLRALTLRRERVARCMALCLDHVAWAAELAEMLVASLLIPTTPIPRKLARLYVLSDVLYNSGSVPGAWRYRAAFEAQLPRIMAHWHDVTRACPGRLSAAAVVRDVVRVLDVWDTWLVFPPAALAAWRAALVSK